MRTVAPAPANASAIAAPMPLLAPVTTARTPSSRGASPRGPASGLRARLCGVARCVRALGFAGGPLGSPGERVARLGLAVHHLLRAGLAAQGAGDRLLGGLVVPVEDLLVVR